MNEFVALSLIPILIAMLSATMCAIVGSFMLVRRQSLLSDALSHSVLLGIVIGFLITGTQSTFSMLGGALAAGVIAVGMIELLKSKTHLDPSAILGLVFTVMFALGVYVLEQSDTSSVHLDVEHALFGNLESLIWLDGMSWGALLDPVALATVPFEFYRLLIFLAVTVAIVALFWRALILVSFDPILAATQGLRVPLVSFGLALLATAAAVASFDAVGAILVVAVFVCPPAAARLLTTRFGPMMGIAVGIGNGIAVLGYVLAGYGPMWFGASISLSASGMIATLGGVAVFAALGLSKIRTF
jgi:manganese/zinc/iron transport system permease protein